MKEWKKHYYGWELHCEICDKLICYYNFLNPEESQVDGLCLDCARKRGREE